jgi:hypothetical protein
MPALLAKTRDVRSCDGFQVESSRGTLGWVEEAWLAESGDPEAFAVRTTEGRRALLLAGEVISVSSEQAWVVVGPNARLLELDAPRIDALSIDGPQQRPRASWTTTGASLAPPQPLTRLQGASLRLGWRRRPAAAAGVTDRPILQLIALLYGAISLLVGIVIALAFLVADLASGSPY